MKCLLLEDNEALRNVIRSLIEAVGVTCVPAASVESAMLLVESESGFTHLLTDWHVGRQPVSSVIDSGRQMHAGINVAIYSGDTLARHSVDEDVLFFQKPIGLEELSKWLKS